MSNQKGLFNITKIELLSVDTFNEITEEMMPAIWSHKFDGVRIMIVGDVSTKIFNSLSDLCNTYSVQMKRGIEIIVCGEKRP